MIDLPKVRMDTPYCGDKLFFNSAGSSLPPSIVTRTMKDYLDDEEMHGGYFIAEKRADEINEFYEVTANLLNTHPRNIAFTYNATDSYARALSSIQFKKGDIILTTEDDYISNQIAFLSLKKRYQVDIIRIKLNDQTDLDLEDFEACMLRYQPKVVAVTHIPTNSGKIQDVESIGMMCEKFDTIYLVDACQSVGQLPIDAHKIKCDFLSGTGRKFLRGPRGTGFLFVSDKMLSQEMAPLMVDMRGAEWIDTDQFQLFPGARRFEMWEFSYSHLLGLSAAIRYANQVGLSNIEKYNQMLCDHLRQALQSVDGVHLYDEGSKLGSIVTFRKGEVNLQHTKAHLSSQQVYFSLSTRSNAQFDFGRKGIDWAVRLSPHYFNTMDEADELLDVISKM